MFLSVCIATWCRKEKLKKIIDALENQSLDRDFYEIIVCDSKSPDGTAQMIDEISQCYDNVVYINSNNVLACKRNDGIKAAKGEIIIFMDDDVVPSYDFLEAHYNANLVNSKCFFCGQIRFDPIKCNSSNYYHFRDAQHLDTDDIERDLPFNNVVVMNLSFRKDYIDTVGYVDERFIGYGCEDIEFGYRIIKSGYKLKYLPEALAFHDEDSSTIIEYGNKLYKTGLYGFRALNKVNPEIVKTLNRNYPVTRFVLSRKLIGKLLSKYLVLTDKKRMLYSYYMYKAYLYSRLYTGIEAQKNHPELSLEDASRGW